MSSWSSVSRARAEATAFAPSWPRCPQGRDCSSAASSCLFQLEKVARHSEGKEIGGLPEGTGTGIWPPTGWKSKKRNEERAAEAPGPGSCHPDTTPAAPAPFAGRGPRPGPGPRQRLTAEGEERISSSPLLSAGARAEAAAEAAEPEDELSKFRELWQGPAERREELLERLLVASVWERTCPVGGWALARWGPPGAEPAAPETELELLRFLEHFECFVLACGRRHRGPGTVSEELR